MMNYLQRFLQYIFAPILRPYHLAILRELDKMKFSNGQAWASRGLFTTMREAEFQVYSQWGDDGIIQFLIRRAEIRSRIFIEFGVEAYREANTRFLLMNNNWKGLVMDGSLENVRHIQREEIYWRYNLTAKHCFVTCDNINRMILESGFAGPVGYMHIDIDGNDYWVWKSIQVVQPDIVSIEYNSVFGADRAVTIPYSPTFNRAKAHHSNLYAGASLLALCDLASEKGYDFVGCNSAGNDAYFVKRESRGSLQVMDPMQGFVESAFRESRDIRGKLTYLSGSARLEAIKGLPVVNTRTDQVELL